jgi:uncharacterized protein YndB with AHSA1/START domain
MHQLRFSVEIAAPRDRVWKVLWDDATYRDWTSVFSEGSHAVSDWKQGSTIRFLDASGTSGMSAVIEQLRPNESMSFRHEAEIKDGVTQPPAAWAGAHENYALATENGRTILTVDVETTDEFREMIEGAFPKALQRVRTLSETA